MLTAEVARQILLKDDPKALDAANTLLDLFKEWCGEEDQPFIEAATWPDKIKGDQNLMMDNWHFINTLHSIDGTPINDHLPKFLISSNVIEEISGSIKSLQWDASHDSTSKFYGHQDARFMKSFSLRNLIHFVGDVHQPLHASEGVSKLHQEGDEGGNLVKTFMKGFTGSNLHWFWDHVFYNFSPKGEDEGELTSPLKNENRHMPQKYAKELMEEFPRENYDSEMFELNPTKWANESFEISKTEVYKGIIEDKPISQEYIDKARKICKERIALGGYRLAVAISEAFKNEVTEKKDEKNNRSSVGSVKSAYIKKMRALIK